MVQAILGRMYSTTAVSQVVYSKTRKCAMSSSSILVHHGEADLISDLVVVFCFFVTQFRFSRHKIQSLLMILSLFAPQISPYLWTASVSTSYWVINCHLTFNFRATISYGPTAKKQSVDNEHRHNRLDLRTRTAIHPTSNPLRHTTQYF
jgi:hypothetical protein